MYRQHATTLSSVCVVRPQCAHVWCHAMSIDGESVKSLLVKVGLLFAMDQVVHMPSILHEQRCLMYLAASHCIAGLVRYRFWSNINAYCVDVDVDHKSLAE